jgi:hypothetical protein
MDTGYWHFGKPSLSLWSLGVILTGLERSNKSRSNTPDQKDNFANNKPNRHYHNIQILSILALAQHNLYHGMARQTMIEAVPRSQ